MKRRKRTRFVVFFMVCALFTISIFTLSISAAPCNYDSPSQISKLSATRSVPGKYEVVITDGYLNVRNIPSINGNVIGILHKGDIIDVYSISEGWAKIKFYGHDGYVAAEYLKEL